MRSNTVIGTATMSLKCGDVRQQQPCRLVRQVVSWMSEVRSLWLPAQAGLARGGAVAQLTVRCLAMAARCARADMGGRGSRWKPATRGSRCWRARQSSRSGIAGGSNRDRDIAAGHYPDAVEASRLTDR
jgi:hypothetical protein